MRTLILVVPVALGLALSACASEGGTSRYNADFDRLAADCEARGGVLSPTGEQSGRPQLDNVCKIRGETARAPSGG